MRTNVLRITLLGCLAAALVAPAAAAADPVRDCSTNGTLTKRYTASELGSALRSMPADVKEYTDCYDQIRRAQLAAAVASGSGGKPHKSSGSGSGSGHGHGGSGGDGSGGAGVPGSGSGSNGGGGSGGSAGAHSPRTGRATPVKIGDREITPGTSGLSAGGAAVPTPLVVVLALLGAGALAFAATRIRSRVAARRDA